MTRLGNSARSLLILALGALALAVFAGRSSVGQQPSQGQPQVQVGRFQIAVASSGVDRNESSHPLVVIDTATGRVWMRDAVFDGRWTDYGSPAQGVKKGGREVAR